MEGAILENERIKDFILGGQSHFTVIGDSHRFTYYVMQPKFNGKLSDTRRFVKVMDTRRGNDMTYIGLLKLENGIWNYEFRVPDKIKDLNLVTVFNTSSIEVVAFSYMWNLLKYGSYDPRIEVWHKGLCACCGRPLTTPQSMLIGWGPVCWKRLKEQEVSETQEVFEAR